MHIGLHVSLKSHKPIIEYCRMLLVHSRQHFQDLGTCGAARGLVSCYDANANYQSLIKFNRKKGQSVLQDLNSIYYSHHCCHCWAVVLNYSRHYLFTTQALSVMHCDIWTSHPCRPFRLTLLTQSPPPHYISEK